MITPIVHDVFFLGQKSEAIAADDKDLPQIVADLRDNLEANRETCVGMAANMVGYRKRAIIVSMGFMDLIMINPVITWRLYPYEIEEGCLSLPGIRKTRRFRKITVEYQDEEMGRHKQDFEGRVAQIIQHECDHLEGVLI